MKLVFEAKQAPAMFQKSFWQQKRDPSSDIDRTKKTWNYQKFNV